MTAPSGLETIAGLQRFACTHLSFGASGIAPMAPAAGRLAPYDPIAPGVVVGFDRNGSAEIVLSRQHGAGGVLLEVRALGETGWLTLEADLDLAALKTLGEVFWGLKISASPRARCTAVIRGTAGRENRTLAAPHPFVVRGTPGRSGGRVELGRAALDFAAQCSRAQFLVFFPPIEARYRIDSLTLAPMAERN